MHVKCLCISNNKIRMPCIVLRIHNNVQQGIAVKNSGLFSLFTELILNFKNAVWLVWVPSKEIFWRWESAKYTRRIIHCTLLLCNRVQDATILYWFFMFLELQIHATCNLKLIILMWLIYNTLLTILEIVNKFAYIVKNASFGPTIMITKNVGVTKRMLLVKLISVVAAQEVLDIAKVCSIQ